MNDQQLAAVKQALEALEIVRPMENPEPAVEEAITALQSIISQDALDKKAENARELGLSYDDEPKIGCVNHDCDKCKAVQQNPMTDEMVTAAARALNKRQAEACGVDKNDHWKFYGDDIKEDAKAALEAAHGITKGNTP
jgi:hypothetical protein